MPNRYKHLTFPSPEDINLKVKTKPSSRHGESTLLVEAARPVKGLVLRSKDGNASFSGNFLDLLPGELQRIVCKHLRREEELEWRCEYPLALHIHRAFEAHHKPDPADLGDTAC